ncbi:V-type ATPase subunit subunit G family protein [Nitratifractor sp.]
MKKTLIALASLAVPALLLAEGHGEEASHYFAITGRETDIVPRIFNFLIFAGLLYYLIADPVRNFFKNRSQSIAQRLGEIERMLQEAREARKNAEQTLAESEKKAEEILRDAQKEVEILKARYEELRARELEALEKQYRERMEVEERKMRREAVARLLDENIPTDEIPLDAHRVVEILSKKAA